MLHVDNILLATDLSDHCGAAARWAQNLKDLTGARVIVEHVVELSVSSWLTSAFEQLENDEARAAAEAKISAWYEEHAGVTPDKVLIRAGSTFAQLTETVQGLHGETILVVSRSGQNAVSRFILGSTAHVLASNPPCTLVIVHPDHPQIGSAPVVTGSDLSANANRVVVVAGQLAETVGTTLEIVHGYGVGGSPILNLETAQDQTSRREVVERQVRRLVNLKGVDYTVHVDHDDEPANAIVEHAKAKGSNVIVLGHSGESQFVQSVLGSTAQRVLNHMPCTLFLVPPLGEGDEEE